MFWVMMFLISLVINTFILYLITDKILILDDTALLKAFIVTLLVGLFNQFIPPLIGNPSGFHAEMFAGIGRYLLLIPPYLFIKYIYSMDWRNFFYFLIANFILKLISTLLILTPIMKLIYKN